MGLRRPIVSTTPIGLVTMDVRQYERYIERDGTNGGTLGDIRSETGVRGAASRRQTEYRGSAPAVGAD
jgi:hypothetical protein